MGAGGEFGGGNYGGGWGPNPGINPGGTRGPNYGPGGVAPGGSSTGVTPMPGGDGPKAQPGNNPTGGPDVAYPAPPPTGGGGSSVAVPLPEPVTITNPSMPWPTPIGGYQPPVWGQPTPPVGSQPGPTPAPPGINSRSLGVPPGYVPGNRLGNIGAQRPQFGGPQGSPSMVPGFTSNPPQIGGYKSPNSGGASPVPNKRVRFLGGQSQ